MEPLMHFILPLASLMLLGEKPKTAVPLAVLGVLPDIDALLLIHRSISHSIIVIAVIFTPLVLYARFRAPELERIMILGFLVTISHPFLDLGGSTPILWPLISDSFMIKLALNGVVDHGVGIKPQLSVRSEPTVFTKHTSLDYPLFTYDGLVTALILLIPIIYKYVQARNS
jgi:membrane-bound metal-dependent hydrolase YbcI (DUF457 family)